MSKVEAVVYFLFFYGVQWVLSISIMILAWNYLVKDFFCAQPMQIKHAIGILIIKVILFNKEEQINNAPPKEENFFYN